MTKHCQSIVIIVIAMLALSGCRHNTTSAKVPPAPPAATAPSARATIPAASPAKVEKEQARRVAEPTEEQLFAQNINDIFFDYDTADIRSDEQAILSRNLQFLAKHSALNILIEGHCDERGSEEYNLTLGESRAGHVRAALIQGGLSPDRVKVVSYGKERPFCSSENESCWQQNRRAHFVLAANSHPGS